MPDFTKEEKSLIIQALNSIYQAVQPGPLTEVVSIVMMAQSIEKKLNGEIEEIKKPLESD